MGITTAPVARGRYLRCKCSVDRSAVPSSNASLLSLTVARSAQNPFCFGNWTQNCIFRVSLLAAIGFLYPYVCDHNIKYREARRTTPGDRNASSGPDPLLPAVLYMRSLLVTPWTMLMMGTIRLALAHDYFWLSISKRIKIAHRPFLPAQIEFPMGAIFCVLVRLPLPEAPTSSVESERFITAESLTSVLLSSPRRAA